MRISETVLSCSLFVLQTNTFSDFDLIPDLDRQGLQTLVNRHAYLLGEHVSQLYIAKEVLCTLSTQRKKKMHGFVCHSFTRMLQAQAMGDPKFQESQQCYDSNDLTSSGALGPMDWCRS